MKQSRAHFGRLVGPALLLGGAVCSLTLSGCGGGVGGNSSSSLGGSATSGTAPGTGSGGTSTPNAQAALNVFVTDAFSDHYKQVLVTLYKIELTTDGTNYQTVFSDTGGQTINLSSLASTKELLASLNVPAGTYTQARVTFGDHFTLVGGDGTSTSVAVDPKVGTQANGQVALTVATPTKAQAGQTSALVVDFKLAGFQLVGGVLRPTVGAGPGGGPGGPGGNCSAHLDGTVANLVAGTSFDLSGHDGNTLHVLLTSTTTVVSGQTGSAVTLANGQSVRVEGAFDPKSQTVTATSVVLDDGAPAQRQRAEGTVASLNGTAGSFVLTVQRADGFQPTGGTITVQTSSATLFGKSKHQPGTLADVAAGASVDAQGTFDARTQTLTARAVFLH